MAQWLEELIEETGAEVARMSSEQRGQNEWLVLNDMQLGLTELAAQADRLRELEKQNAGLRK